MTREAILLTAREQQRAMVLTQVCLGHVTGVEAARLMALSVRHTRRVLAAFRRQGPAALAHGNRGRTPPNRLPEPIRRQVVTAAQTTYRGFNHQYLAECLADEGGLTLCRMTVSRILAAAGLPPPRTRRPPRHRSRRPRKPQAGLLLQLDASHHDWLEGRGPQLALHGAIDDATSEVPAATFRLAEDAAGYLTVLRDVLRRRGVPAAVYTDHHSTFEVSPQVVPSVADQLAGVARPLTQVGRALAELGVQWMPASSPQAKGRIERLWGTFQDRLGSELRRAQAATLAEANAVLRAFLPRYNRRFRRPPAQPASAYRPLPPGLRLEDVCCFQYLRTVANDNTITLEQAVLQVRPGPGGRGYAKAEVLVREHLDGTVSVTYQGQRLGAGWLTAPPPDAPLRARDLPRPRAQRKRRAARAPETDLPRRSAAPPPASAPRRPWTPPPDHPWKQAFVLAQRRRAAKHTAAR